MRNDKTTLKDLAIFTTEGGGGVFDLIDRTVTQQGRAMLRKHIYNPPDTWEALTEVQQTIQFWSVHHDLWPKNILNGTLVMLDKYFEAADVVATPPAGIALLFSSFFQKIFNRQEYFFTQFSLSHLADLFKGCRQLAEMASLPGVPPLLLRELRLVQEELSHRLVDPIIGITQHTKYTELVQINYRARRELKHMVYRLIHSFARMDAWRSMALASREHKWVYPELLPGDPVCFDAVGLYHPLLQAPVAYDLKFEHGRNFVLLTGANMSGKTTFMRSLGVTALLAHLGMGVPARQVRISFLQGIITNMQVEDNILKGESYFYAEVLRMKHTAEKVLQPQPHLVLMDELFKGTNVHDACECTRAVVDGLLQHPNHLMILSTHLYEVAQQFSNNNDIIFQCFVTRLTDEGGYNFTYELQPGISNDRIGYRILQKEGVIDLLSRRATARS
jgi:DNA mismatch repair ATPase MutS